MKLAGFALLALLAVTSSTFAEDKIAAESAFRAAKELERSGKLAEACPLYEASYRADPQLGALLNLANCHELIGRTATAWVELRDATELASRRGDARVEYTKKRLAAIEPRLIRIRIVAPAGVVIERNGTDVTALSGQALAVDPGTHRVRATRDGYVAWETRVEAQREGETVHVEVPVLVRIEIARVEPKPVSSPTPVVVVPVPASKPTPTSHRRAIALAIGSAGIATTTIGLGFGFHARSQWSASRDPSSCDDHGVCNETGLAQIATARRSASIATYAVGAGAALLVTAGVVWFTAPSKTERRVSVIPAVDPTGASITAFARF